MLIRPIKKNDLEKFYELSLTSSIGITNLPKNRALLEKKIESSLEAFSKKISSPLYEKYIFVLEDPSTGEICGTAGIHSKTGVIDPLYYYQLEKVHLKNDPKEIHLLKPVSYKEAPSEIGGLYLNKTMRGHNLGKLLSLSRFLFVASFKERFTSSIFTEIRGVIEEDNNCPFWEGIGKHFFSINYDELMKLTENGRGFVKDILPKHPIYLELLPKEVQQVIGLPHVKSQPALKMLNEQGFTFCHEVDLFDGGPRLCAEVDKIKVIKESVIATISKIETKKEESKEEELLEKYLISNENLEFRALYGSLSFHEDETVEITNKTAEELRVNVGDTIRYVRRSL